MGTGADGHRSGLVRGRADAGGTELFRTSFLITVLEERVGAGVL